MKTLLSLTLVLTFAVSAVAGDIKDYVGKWNYTDYDVSLRPEKKAKVDQFFQDMYIEFKKDMTYSAKIMGTVENGTWELNDDNSITITNSREDSKKIQISGYDGETMTIDLGYGGFIMKKEKEDEEEAEDSDHNHDGHDHSSDH